MAELRRATEADVEFLVALANDPEVREFLGVRTPSDAEEILAELRLDTEAPRERGWFVIEVDGERAGGVAFRTSNPRSRIASVHRLAVAPGFRGRGAALEALRLLTRRLLRDDGFHRVEAETYGYNERAQRLFERAGFTREGVRRLAYLRDGRWQDGICFGLVEEDLDRGPF